MNSTNNIKEEVVKEEVVFNKEQQEAFDLIVNGIGNVLLTGNAGTGKSFVIKHAIQALHDKNKTIQVCATTGLAATAIDGKTFHSVFSIFPKFAAQFYDRDGRPIHPQTIQGLINLTLDDLPVHKGDLKKKQRDTARLIRSLDVIIIDEVSMMHVHDLRRLDAQLQNVRNNKRPFGGIRMVFVGDFLQLEPVHNNNAAVGLPRGKSAFAYESDVSWKNAGIQIIQLTKIVRQQDEYFATFLNNVRCGIWHPWMQEVVDKCKSKPIPESGVPYFTSKNAVVDAINKREMEKLTGESWIHQAIDRYKGRWDTRLGRYVDDDQAAAEYWDKNCLALKTLELKVGTQVICLVNNPLGHHAYKDEETGEMYFAGGEAAPNTELVNGDVGVVVGFAKAKSISHSTNAIYPNGIPVVEFKPRPSKVWRAREVMLFAFEAHTFNQGLLTESRSQFPIKPCWALTVHKSQGMTLDAAVVDIADAFSAGQVYVAMSRVRTLDGLYIKSFDADKIKAHEKSLEFYGIKGNYKGDEQQGPGEGNQGAKPIEPNKPNNGGGTMNNNPETHRWIATDEDTIRCANCDCRYGGKQHEQKCNPDIEPDMNPQETKKENKIIMHTNKTPMFKQKEYEFLSNMYPCDIDGYKCVESFYQAMKSKDPAVRASIKQMDGRNAKSAGKNHVIVREDWESIKLKVMRYALEKKFAAGTELAVKLVATGHTVLVETNWWHDNFWGDCYCQKCESIKGENHLGKMLMEIRDNLRNGGGGTPTNEPVGPTNNQEQQEEEVIEYDPNEVNEPTMEEVKEAVEIMRKEIAGALLNVSKEVMLGEQIYADCAGGMRMITNDHNRFEIQKVRPSSSYTFAFLDHFFGGKEYHVHVMPQFIDGEPNKELFQDDSLTDNVVIRWSSADKQYTITMADNNGWLDQLNKIGLVVGNSKKMAKRLQELVRQTAAYKYFEQLKIEVMDPAVIGVDEKFVDGISSISRSFAISLYTNNQHASQEFIDGKIKAINNGSITVVSLRVLTPIGLIKGNAIIVPDKMMNGYDIRTFTPNVKSELATTNWYWATIEPSFGRSPLKTDDLTMAIYRDVKGIVDPVMLIDTLRVVVSEQTDKIINGDPNDWIKQVREWAKLDADDLNAESYKLTKTVDKLVDRLEEIGLSIESSQLLMYLKALNFGQMYGIIDKKAKAVKPEFAYLEDNGTWMPVPYAYRAHIMTKEVLEIFGFKFKNKGYEGFYHEESHCFVVPGEFFVANYKNHGGYDLDDTINVMIRQFTTKEGSNSLCAFLLRNPNDFSEWSEIPISPKEVEYCYHRIGDIPTISWEELNEKVPKLTDLIASNEITYKHEELPGASKIVLDPVYSIKDEIRNRMTTLMMPGGTGATVLPKIVYYSIVGKFISEQVASNEQLIDAVQQGMATPEDIAIIRAATDEIYRNVKQALVRKECGLIDSYWAETRITYHANKEHGFWGKNYSYVMNRKDSPFIQLYREREKIVREMFNKLTEWANDPHAPSKLMSIIDPDQGAAAIEFNRLMEKYYNVVDPMNGGKTNDWAREFVLLLEQSDAKHGEEYTDRKILRLWRHSFNMKRVKPKANWDKWLFVVDPMLDKLPIDWLIRAYRRLN